ncbi:hypothetical protein RHGRI_031624 [Rhododendron griersonianum]|uniref:F-box domain-containing protein n=1 Tax=Rhododendron griersonianum TaxID=479676 RepID=A0AAV6IC03_9ERIC|nr:hypothetical protein RHGRI_031624 [Rhododendron griersonianum]
MEEEEEDDIISTLPDSILHQILSSLDTNAAVQTCALSRRWRYVWVSLPNLHFDYDEFPGADDGTKMGRFARFVNRVLSLRDTSTTVSRFYLWSTYYLDPGLVKNCIFYAFQHNVRELMLWAPYPKPLEFHTFESLTSLALVCNDFSSPPDKPLGLPALRTLHFSCCSYGCANFITETVGNCPNLETFILDDLMLKSLNITAPNLRNLELAYKDESCNESEIVVSAPRLTSFKLEGEASPVFSGASLPCLQNVHVDLVPCFNDEWHPPDAGIKRRMPLNVINMLEQLREANYVTLSVKTLELANTCNCHVMASRLSLHYDLKELHYASLVKLSCLLSLVQLNVNGDGSDGEKCPTTGSTHCAQLHPPPLFLYSTPISLSSEEETPLKQRRLGRKPLQTEVRFRTSMEEDRISSLPDSILYRILSSITSKPVDPDWVTNRILSSIDTRSAVQTSILSKRWRYVWKALPYLHFDYYNFPGTDGCEETKIRRFTHFVNQVLSLRDASSSIFRFHLVSSFLLDPGLVKNWIVYAVRHNVRELLLWPACNGYPRRLEYPRCLTTFKLLISLRLWCHEFNTPPDKPLRLPALKTLHISGCSYNFANFIAETVGNCPNLEALILDDIALNSLNITAPNLRDVELTYCDQSCSESMIMVSAPRLISFTLEGKALPVFSAASLPCLQNVHVNLNGLSYYQPDEDILQRMPLNVMKMLEQLGEANCVTLSMETVEVLAMDPDSLNNRPSPFRKLKHLKLTTPSRSSNLPLNVITYLTKGSSSDTLVGEFYLLGKWLRA